MSTRLLRAAVFFLLVGAWSGAVNAQTQTTIGTPAHSLNDGFFENIGTSFNFSLRGAPIGPNARGVVGLGPNMQLQPNIQFQNLGFPGIPNGQGNPASAGTFGFSILNPNFNASFFVAAGQGSTRSSGTVAPSVTVMNGQQGTFSATTQFPFVIGVVPVVGGFSPGFVGFDPSSAWSGSVAVQPSYSTALQEKLDRIHAGATSGVRPGAGGGSSGGLLGVESLSLAKPAGNDVIGGKLLAARDSSAGQAADSVRDIQAAQEAADAEKERELEEILEKARAAEAEGKKSVAKVYYQQAARRVEGSQLVELQAKIRELGQK